MRPPFAWSADFRQSVLCDVVQYHFVVLRCDGEIKEFVGAHAPLFVARVECRFELAITLLVLKGTFLEGEELQKRSERPRRDARSDMFLDDFPDKLTKIFVTPLSTGESDDTEHLRQLLMRIEVIERRYYLAPHQVPRRPERRKYRGDTCPVRTQSVSNGVLLRRDHSAAIILPLPTILSCRPIRQPTAPRLRRRGRCYARARRI